MLRWDASASLKSNTLPRLDGQDEEDVEVLENQFEILSIVNSCPDLTVLEVDALPQGAPPNNGTVVNGGGGGGGIPSHVTYEDAIDGISFKRLVDSSSGSFRRSTSLSSFAVDVSENRKRVIGTGSHEPRGHVQYHQVVYGGTVVEVSGLLENNLKKEKVGTIDVVKGNLHGGSSGYLHKSVSSPSVTQCFVGPVGAQQTLQNHKSRVQSDAHQHSSKRSFFRRKQKSKSSITNSNVARGSRVPNRMDEMTTFIGIGNGISSDDTTSRSLAFAALYDPSLGLRDVDAECWALSMSQDLVRELDDKEVKRQEHMYELILTEKHHCLTLALMQHLFVGDMKKSGFARYARLLFPELHKLLDVHFSFLRRMRERQLKFRELGQPMDTLTDILLEQFTSDQYHLMIKLYGLLCASHTKSLDIFRSLLKDSKFASLVSSWDKESLLQRKNVRECLLLVAQRITKYPLLIEPILKTSLKASPKEREEIEKTLFSSKLLISKVDRRVEQRQRLVEICQRIDPKSYVIVGQRRRGRDDIVSVPSRRLLFHGQAIVNNNNSNIVGGNSVNRHIPCSVFILTDSLIFTQEINLKYHFVSPPVALNNLIVREDAREHTSFFLMFGTDSRKPEMIELKVISPGDRQVWMKKIKKAITKCVEETEAGSDADEETDAADLSEMKTTKALEELQELDKQLVAALKARSKIVDGLRGDKTYNWVPNNFQGKDTVLSALSATCAEVQNTISAWETNANISVIRSASCVSELTSQSAILGLPKRADTFAGFDSQQRSVLELQQWSPNNKLLMEMVIQLHQLCGDLFSQMLPQVMPSIYQTHHQLQRRMEELREAQQRLETDKALFQQDVMVQREMLEKERLDLTNLKSTLQREQDDITQQREQLYRKLEALQKQGIRPPMDPVSPLSGSTNIDKGPSSNLVRRPVAQPSITTTSSVPANVSSVNGVKSRQQLPLFLASNSSFKAAKGNGTSGIEGPTPGIRQSNHGSFKVSPIGAGGTAALQQFNSNDVTRLSSKSSAARGAQHVQQVLPLRLSEGNGNVNNKTASLPRGVGSRSVSSMLNQIEQIQPSHVLRTSNSSSGFSSGSIHSHVGEDFSHSGILANSSYLYGPVQSDRKTSYDNRIEHEERYKDNGIAPIHRRSGSSPVPMSTLPPRRFVQPEIHYHQHQHPFFKQRDDDSEKILFL